MIKNSNIYNTYRPRMESVVVSMLKTKLRYIIYDLHDISHLE